MRRRIAMQVVLTSVVLAVLAPAAQAAFSITEFNADVLKKNGDVVTQAGSTPYVGITEFQVQTETLPPGSTAEQIKRIRVDLPPGLISNPQATPLCKQADFAASACDQKSVIGTVDLTASGTDVSADVYNLEPAPGQVSDFGFQVAGIPGLGSPLVTHIIGGVRDTTDYGLFFTIDVPNVPGPGLNLSYSKLTFHGNPGNPDWATGADSAPFIRLPTACVGPQTTTLTIETYSGKTYTRGDTTNDGMGNLIGASGCDLVPFAPTLSLTPDTTRHDSPVGADVVVGAPWENDPAKLAYSHVKDTVVVLPPGMTINPSAANGLQACTDEQFGQGTHNEIKCPDASKVGTASIKSPVLADPLTGNVYLGQPQAGNPYRLFVVVEGYGLSVRLEGVVTPDPVTGQLTTTFANTPQVPFETFELKLNGGPAATLANPLACGVANTTSTITPYSGNAAATPASSFTVDADGSGGACPPTPFTLGFGTTTANAAAGAFTPFGLTITRDDGQQFLGGLTVRQPAGLLGIIQSVPLCDEALAAQGACPEASRVGTSTVSSGAGSTPFTLTGPVYLAGPYGGGPFSLVIAIRALAGPFDLGTVVVRAAIKVDKIDSHLTIETPQLPTILQGIPLRLRTVRVDIDRQAFLFNATSCDQQAVGATLVSTEGASQNVSSPYQPTGCDALPYAPRMTVTTGAAKKGQAAPLSVTLTQAKGEANSKTVSVHLPPQLAANFNTLQGACPQATFEEDPHKCGAGSKVGTVTAVTPVLAQPLSGTVYLESHGQAGKLPTLEAVLEGQGITVDLSGTIELGNGITSTFKVVPDVPITSFKLDLPTAPNPALAAGADLCSTPLSFDVSLLGQNGKKVEGAQPVGIAGCGVQITKVKLGKRKATISVYVPAAGTVTFTGKGLKRAKKAFKAAGPGKVAVKLNKAGVKKLAKALQARKKSKRKLVVKLKAAFAPAKGATAGGQAVKASSASKKLTFKK